jgi:hypothetical protein
VRFFYDTEFYEDGKQIHLISFGMVSEEGHELYWENSDFDWDIVPKDHWLQENVRPHLDNHLFGITKDDLIFELKNFVQFKSLKNEFWGYYSDYDHVVLAQLFGRMVDMPEGFPWYTLDLKQEAVRLGNPKLPEQSSSEHHALNDARWNRDVYEFLQDYEEKTGPQIW